MIRLGALAPMCVLLGACATQQNYEGPQRAADEVARISGDLRVTAGAPVSVILRKVDDRELSLSERSADVLPGTHRFLVDCRVAETGSANRFTLEEEVYAGEHYRLVAETGTGMRQCTAVQLELID
jgi:hypothetical protein